MSAMTDETWWQREIVSDELKDFGARLRGHFGAPAVEWGTKGNEAHKVGRHRSLEWNLNSRFATRRNYGTTDPRDTKGNRRLIRAFDLGLPRSVLFEVSRNLEAACRDGRAYMLAEWYGDLGDDSVVDGWFEGHDSTSDSSHKTHVHGGLWTIYADDATALNDLFNIMIGEGDMDAAGFLKILSDPKVQRQMKAFAWAYIDDPKAGQPAPVSAHSLLINPNGELRAGLRALTAASAADEQRDAAALVAIQRLTAVIEAGGGSVDSAAIIAAVREVGAQEGEKVAALLDRVDALQAELAERDARLANALDPADS